MDWTKLFDVIGTRSFSSLWYWLVVALVYARASGGVLGVPAGLIQRARREGGQALDELVWLTHFNIRRLHRLTADWGVVLVGAACFVHVSLIVLGWGFGMELARAVELLAIPLTLFVVYSILTAQEVLTTDPPPERLVTLLLRQRVWAQLTAAAALAVTVLQGMAALMPVLRW